MAVGGPLLDPERPQARRQEIEELDVGRGRLPPLKRLNQADWRRASRADKHAVARLDRLDGSLGRAQSVGNQRELRPVAACPRTWGMCERRSQADHAVDPKDARFQDT